MTIRGSSRSRDRPAGWGSVRSLADILPREHLGPEGYRELARQNKPDGFMCVSCAWPKPADHHPAEFCEEGAKATAWKLIPRDHRDFAIRTVAGDIANMFAEAQTLYEVEAAGRLGWRSCCGHFWPQDKNDGHFRI